MTLDPKVMGSNPVCVQIHFNNENIIGNRLIFSYAAMGLRPVTYGTLLLLLQNVDMCQIKSLDLPLTGDLRRSTKLGDDSRATFFLHIVLLRIMYLRLISTCLMKSDEVYLRHAKRRDFMALALLLILTNHVRSRLRTIILLHLFY